MAIFERRRFLRRIHPRPGRRLPLDFHQPHQRFNLQHVLPAEPRHFHQALHDQQHDKPLPDRAQHLVDQILLLDVVHLPVFEYFLPRLL